MQIGAECFQYTLQLLAPSGVGGISAGTVKVPANANEAKLLVKVAANVKALSRDDFKVRVQAKVSNATLTQEEPFSLTVTEAPKKE